MNTAPQTLELIIGTVAGVAIGSIVAFFATYYVCAFIDYLRGKSGGDGIVTVGCLFLIVTVPAGAIIGGKLGYWVVGLYLIKE